MYHLFRLITWRFLGSGLLMLFMLTLTSCRKDTTNISNNSSQMGNTQIEQTAMTTADDAFLEVDCLLPGQIRKLGSMTYMGPRRPVKSTAADCEVRGGEYVTYDRSSYQSALAVWMSLAEKNDSVAQTYVGEIYMRSPADHPRYDLARQWLEKAAVNGHRRAQINLGYLYENGLGGPEDMEKAVVWYGKASGSNPEDILQQYKIRAEQRNELTALKKENNARITELAKMKDELKNTRQRLADSKNELAQYTSGIKRHQDEIRKQQLLIAEVERKLALQSQIGNPELEKELSHFKTVLSEKERALTAERQKVASLNAHIADVQHISHSFQSELVTLAEKIKNLPGPKIEIIDPQLMRTRGIVVAPVTGIAEKRRIIGRIWAPAGLKTLTVNDRKPDLTTDGVFSIEIPVTALPEARILITAYDQNNQSDRLEFTLSPNLVEKEKITTKGSKIGSSIDFGTFHALVIGNNNYQKIPNLKTAVDDANEISRILKERYRFQVITLLNADRKTILSSLNDMRKRLTEKDNFLVYYAGHGTLEEKNTQGYWLPIDAAPDDSTNWLRTDDVTGIMNLIAAKQIMIVADACYSGIMTRAALVRLDSGKSPEAYEQWLKKMASYKSRIVISSGENKPVLDGGGGKHSVFAKALIETLNANSDILLGIDLHRAIADKVITASMDLGLEQVPQYAGLNQAGHELGDFIFIPVR